MTFQPKDLLLFVWVHGFKGNEVTFESLPDRVCHLLRETHPSLRVESRVFPAYQTRGDLKAAVLAFVDWLTTLVVELEVNHGAGGGAGKAKVVLMGHSMGGLLIADAARDIAANTREGDPLWPLIVALVAFDTPHVFKHGISTAAGYYDTARTVASNLAFLSPVALGLGIGKFGVGSGSGSGPGSASPNAEAGPSRSQPSSGNAAASPPPKDAAAAAASKSWFSLPPGLADKRALYGLGAVAMGAAAVGGAYYSREHFVNGWKYGYEHMTFVGNLWDGDALERRLEAIEDMRKEHGVAFWNHYTHLPPLPASPVARTFTIQPRPSHASTPHWHAQRNTLAADEVAAHMGMFNPKTNDGFYELGLAVVRDVGERVEREGVRRAEMGEKLGAQGAGVDVDVEMDERERGAQPDLMDDQEPAWGGGAAAAAGGVSGGAAQEGWAEGEKGEAAWNSPASAQPAPASTLPTRAARDSAPLIPEMADHGVWK